MKRLKEKRKIKVIFSMLKSGETATATATAAEKKKVVDKPSRRSQHVASSSIKSNKTTGSVPVPGAENTFDGLYKTRLNSVLSTNDDGKINEFLLNAMPYIFRYHSVESTDKKDKELLSQESHDNEIWNDDNGNEIENGIGNGDDNGNELENGNDSNKWSGGVGGHTTRMNNNLNVNVTSRDNKGKVYDDYVIRVEQGHTAGFQKSSLSSECCNAYFTMDYAGGSMACTKCGLSEDFTDFKMKNCHPTGELTGISYSNSYTYKRLNHFIDWLVAFQGHQTTVISDTVIDSVRVELKKQRIYKTEHLTSDVVLKILKRLRLSSYYEHRHLIYNMLKGTSRTRIDRDLENQLIYMFKQVEDAFIVYRQRVPSLRKNFLSYSFILHKFCQLMERDDLAVSFPLLKSRTRLASQDQIWKWLCTHLRWEYIPSI